MNLKSIIRYFHLNLALSLNLPFYHFGKYTHASKEKYMEIFNNAKNKVHKPFVDPKRDFYDSEEHAVKIYTETRNLIEAWIKEYENIWR